MLTVSGLRAPVGKLTLVSGLTTRQRQKNTANRFLVIAVAVLACLAKVLCQPGTTAFVASSKLASIGFLGGSCSQAVTEQISASAVVRQAKDDATRTAKPNVTTLYLSAKMLPGTLLMKASFAMAEDGALRAKGMGINCTHTMVKIGALMPSVMERQLNWTTKGQQIALYPYFGPEIAGKTAMRMNYTWFGKSKSLHRRKWFTLKVASSSSIGKVAGAIAGKLRERTHIQLIAVGAPSTYIAVKAIIRAQIYLNDSPRREKTVTLGFVPSQTRVDMEEGTENKTRMLLQVISGYTWPSSMS